MAVEPLPLTGRIDITDDDIPRLRAEGWDYIPTNITSGYRPYWEMYHAIREFVQNSLDETEVFDIRLTAEGLEISDQGKGFLVTDLLFHYREKPKWARGQFGEGLKIACIVCLRNGYPLYIWTTDKVVRPLFLKKRFIEHGVVQEARVVYFFWHAFPREHGTSVLIQGYKGELFLDRFVQKMPSQSFLFSMQGEVEGHRFTHSMIDYPIGTAGPSAHRLYVRDIYVTDFWEPALLSYNLWEVDLDPDRVGLKDPHQVVTEISHLWAYCTNENLIRLWMKYAVVPVTPPPPSFIEMKETLWIAYENKELWRRVWRELFGDAVLRTDPEWARRATHLGWRVVEAPYSVVDTLRRVVKTDRDVVEEDERKKRVPVSPDLLTLTQQKNLALIYWLQEKLIYLYAVDRGPKAEAKIVVYATLPHAGEQTGDEIRFRQDTLNEEGSTVETFIHELAHYTGEGAEDLTDDHVREMQYLSWLLWTLREHPTSWDLWDAMMKKGVTPKFRPRGVRPKVKPVYPIKAGDMVKVVSGVFAEKFGRVTEVQLESETGRFLARLQVPDSPTSISVYTENLAPLLERASLFSVGDVVKILPGVVPPIPFEGEQGEVVDILYPSPGEAFIQVKVNVPPEYPTHTYKEIDLVYVRRGPFIPPKMTPQVVWIQPHFGERTREGIVRGKITRNIQRLREKLGS